MTRTSAVAPPPPRSSSLTDNYTKVRFGSFTYYDDPGAEVRFSSGPIQSKSFSHFHGGSFHSSPSHSFPSQQKPPKPPRPNPSSSSSSSKVRRSSSSSTTMAAINSHSSSSPRVRPTASTSFSHAPRRSSGSSPRGSSSSSPFPPPPSSSTPSSSSSLLLRGFTSPRRIISPHSHLHRVHSAPRGGDMAAAFEAEIARGRVAAKAEVEDSRVRSCLLGKRPERCAKGGEAGGGAPPLTFNRLRLSERGGVSAAPAGPPLGLDRLDCCAKLGDGAGWSPPCPEWTAKSAEEDRRAESERSFSNSLEDHLRAQRVQFEMSPRQLPTGRHLSSPREPSGRTKVADIKVAEAAAFTLTALPHAPIPEEKQQKTQPKAWVPSGPAKSMLGSLFAAVPKKLNDAPPASDAKDDTMSVLSLEFARARLRRRSGKTPVGIPKMGDVLATKDGKGSQLAGNDRLPSLSLSFAPRIAEQEPASSSASLGLKSPPSKISEKSRSQRSSEQQERKRKGSVVGKSATRRSASSSSAVSGWYLGRLREIARCFTR